MSSSAPNPKDLSALFEKSKPDIRSFEEVYKDLHRHPELSFQEKRTSGIAAQHLKALSVYDVQENIGGYGVTGIFRNGSGPTVMLRADMDGLPVREATGLPYASTDKATDRDGREVSVMAACGHDMHTTVLMAVASTLAAAKDHWTGTLICLFQPAEEFVAGAQAMVDDGLYEAKHNIPVPDIVLGQHVLHIKAGTIGLSPGPCFAALDTLSIRIFGRGGHGTRPDMGIDPVLTAAHVVVRLQSILTREVHPAEMCVLTVGSIVAGDAANVIPDHADIKLTMRSYNPAVHERVLHSIHRVVKAECEATGCEKPPEITTLMHTPFIANDDDKTARLSNVFKSHFGSNLVPQDPNPGSEDVGVLASAVKKPLIYWLFGGVDPETWDKSIAEGTVSQLPYNHSALYAPVVQPTLNTGVEALSLAALEFLGSK